MFVLNYETCLLWIRTSGTLCQRPLNILLSEKKKNFLLEGILNFSDLVKNLTTGRKKNKGWNEVLSLET